MHTYASQPTRHLARALALAGLLVALSACGPANPAGTTGTLQVVVAGLPSETDAAVTVGAQRLTGSASLTLAPGAYQITAEPVLANAAIMGDRLAPDQTQLEATVSVGETTTVTVTYAVAQRALLLGPDYGSGHMTVLTAEDLVEGGEPSARWALDGYSNGFSGMALGPDGRLYVADYSNDLIVVVDGAELTTDGDITHAAIITIDGPTSPVGAGFDSSGNLWLASDGANVLMRFDDVLGVSTDIDLAPTLVVSVDDTTYAAAFSSVHHVFVDHLDNVWVADYGSEAIYRFEGLGELTGSHTVVPDLFLTFALSDISMSGYTLYYPTSLVVDTGGTLYVGNEDSQVSRFDDALTLTGPQDLEASAYLDTRIRYPRMVTLDQSGALWVGHFNGELVRLVEPESYAGYADVSDHIQPELTWVKAGSAGFPDRGTLTFVPTQGWHAGY
jgi:hypothetical protein